LRTNGEPRVPYNVGMAKSPWRNFKFFVINIGARGFSIGSF